MTNVLILFEPLANFGEALKKDCPKNDCVIYRNIYERYCEEYADYQQIKATVPNLSETTIRTLEHAIRASEKELYEMWFNNSAVLKQRDTLGMVSNSVSKLKTEQVTKMNFHTITKNMQTLAGFLQSLPVLDGPWDREFQKQFCTNCLHQNCNSCPHEEYRNNPLWWLKLEAAEGVTT